MLRVVADINCLLASINPKGDYFLLYQLFKAQAFEWVLSNEILTEYEEQLTRRYSASLAAQVHEILTLAPNSRFQEAYYRWQLITDDPDDNKFVDVAIAANADYVVTNDRHFSLLARLEFPKVPLLTIRQFLAKFPK